LSWCYRHDASGLSGVASSGWLFILGSARLIYDRFATYRTTHHIKHTALVNQSLQPHAPVRGQ